MKKRLALDREKVLCSDSLEECHRPIVTGNQHMLAVINHIAGCFINERIGSAAEFRFLLEKNNRNVTRCEFDGGGKPAQPAADNNDGA